MKKPMKKRPMPAPVKMGAAKMPAKMEQSAMDKEVPGPAEGSSAEERYDERQAARKSRPNVI